MADQPPAARAAMGLMMTATVIQQEEAATITALPPAPFITATTPSCPHPRTLFSETDVANMSVTSSPPEFHVGVSLPSFLSMCVYKFPSDVFFPDEEEKVARNCNPEAL
jgi:hypothetical protein